MLQASLMPTKTILIKLEINDYERMEKAGNCP